MSVEAVPGKRKPSTSSSDSGPEISMMSGLVMGSSMAGVKWGTSRGCMLENFRSMRRMVSSGSKSPAIQRAMLFGT